MKTLLVLLTAVGLCGCAATDVRCSDGGDLSWPKEIPQADFGNTRCYQKLAEDGSTMNDGRFEQYYSTGDIALEGIFLNGVKHGTWIMYDKKGKEILRREYKHGRYLPPKQEEENIPKIPLDRPIKKSEMRK